MYRYLQATLQQELKKPTRDVVVLYGARQVGKTTLIKNYLQKGVYINLDKGYYVDIFNSNALC